MINDKKGLSKILGQRWSLLHHVMHFGLVTVDWPAPLACTDLIMFSQFGDLNMFCHFQL